MATVTQRSIPAEKAGEKRSELSWVDFAVLCLFALTGFLFFSHPDIIGTAERSFLMLNGNPLKFYQNAEAAGGGANYLPTTFFLFAIWNLPLKLFGAVPAAAYSSSVVQILWYKLLPVCAYAASCCMVYRIVGKVTSDSSAAKTVMYCFAGFPLAFFSQFIFCQYDIFTVLFMLLGIERYFGEWNRKDKLLFCLYFALAASCKYYAILIFAILAVLREKSILRLMLYALAGVSVAASEAAVYLLTDSAAFTRQVLGFGVLENANGFELTVGNRTISLMVVFFCALLAWAYFTAPETRDELVDFSLYFSCGACLVLFLCTSWHPQWLLFGSFFWTFSTCRNQHSRAFLLIEAVWGILFSAFVVNQWYLWSDQYLFLGGVLRNLLSGKLIETGASMASFYRLNQSRVNLDYSVLTAILAIEFFFKHPKFCAKQIKFDPPAMRTRMAAGALSFFVPAFLCLPSMAAQPDRLWSSAQNINSATKTGYVELSDGDSVTQKISVQACELTRVIVATRVKNSTIKSDTAIVMEIRSSADGTPLKTVGEAKGSAIKNGSYTVFEIEGASLQAGEYWISFSRADQNTSDAVQMLTCTSDSNPAQTPSGQSAAGQLIMAAGGKKSGGTG